VAAAQAAFPAWADTPPIRRARVMFKFLQLLNEHKDELAHMITAEHGKVFTDAQGEVSRGIDIVEFACGIPQLLKGDFTDQVSTGIDNWTLRQPLGVVAGITPFNFPVMVPMWMFPVAIAAGNTFVLKPSPTDPSPSLLHGRAAQAGRPARRRVQRGAGRQGRRRRAARAPRRQGHQLRRLHAHRQLHLRNRRAPRQARAGPGRREEPHGGHARRRHRPDRGRADRRGLRLGRRALHGDLVAVLVGDVADKIIPKLIERTKTLKVSTAPTSRPRWARSSRARRTSASPATSRRREGRREAAGRRPRLHGRVAGEGCGDGFWMGGTLFDHVTPEMRIYKEEIFGPVLGCVRVANFKDAVTSSTPTSSATA
jgi:malonate-semialdehyde dehydrogenase (acetylating)/methylmalonate-semialdehyde dehydrogenase